MLRFHVSNMTCGGCAKSVTRAVHGVDPSARIDIDLSARTIAVATADDASNVIAALARAGYQAELHPSG